MDYFYKIYMRVLCEDYAIKCYFYANKLRK